MKKGYKVTTTYMEGVFTFVRQEEDKAILRQRGKMVKVPIGSVIKV